MSLEVHILDGFNRVGLFSEVLSNVAQLSEKVPGGFEKTRGSDGMGFFSIFVFRCFAREGGVVIGEAEEGEINAANPVISLEELYLRDGAEKIMDPFRNLRQVNDCLLEGIQFGKFCAVLAAFDKFGLPFTSPLMQLKYSLIASGRDYFGFVADLAMSLNPDKFDDFSGEVRRECLFFNGKTGPVVEGALNDFLDAVDFIRQEVVMNHEVATQNGRIVELFNDSDK